jgi:hypothetical protein
MRAALGPLHLLLFAEAPADDLVDGRLDKTGADALGFQDLEQAAFGLLVHCLDTSKALVGRDIVLIVSSEGEDALADNDLEMLLFLLPVADIAPINPDRHGAIRDVDALHLTRLIAVYEGESGAGLSAVSSAIPRRREGWS